MHNFLVLSSLLLGFCIPCFGAEPPTKSGLLLTVDFQMRDSKKTLQTKNELILNKQNTNWTPLTPNMSGVVLLGKLQDLSPSLLKVQYMIVDTNTSPVSIKQMSVVSEIGKIAKISSQTEDEETSIALTAKDTDYRE